MPEMTKYILTSYTVETAFLVTPTSPEGFVRSVSNACLSWPSLRSGPCQASNNDNCDLLFSSSFLVWFIQFFLLLFLALFGFPTVGVIFPSLKFTSRKILDPLLGKFREFLEDTTDSADVTDANQN